MLASSQNKTKKSEGERRGERETQVTRYKKQRHLDPGWMLHATSTVTAAALSHRICMLTYEYLCGNKRNIHQ
jgi:hypothetical protein